MLRNIVSGILVTMLLMSMLTSAFNIPQVEASGTIYIRADGSIDPPTAPIFTADNITYIFTDNIYETIVIERENIVVDGNGYTVQGTESGYGVHLSWVSYVTLKNTRVLHFSTGIRLTYSQYCIVADNNVSSTWIGISLDSSSHNTFYGNTVSTNVSALNYGIYMGGAHNTFVDNVIAKFRVGIHIYGGNNIFSGNNISDNWTGIYLYYGGDCEIFHNNFVNNTRQVYIYITHRDRFDDGYPSGGNYWSDYTGIDMYSGPYQNETGSDGIGDTPYIVYATYQDNYPLMRSWDATSPWADDDNDGILNYLDVPNFKVLTSSALEKLVFGFDWPVKISAILPEVDYTYMMGGLYRWGVKTTNIQNFMLPVVMDLGNVMGALNWLHDNAPWFITEKILNGANEYFCSDGHYRLLFFVHSDFEVGEVLTVLAELMKAIPSGPKALEKRLDFFIDLLELVDFELYLLKGVYSVSANLVIDLNDFAEFAEEFIMTWKDILMILIDLELAFITASTGPAFLILAAKVLVKAFKLFIDYIVFDHLKVKNRVLDLIKIILVAIDPPGERVVLELYNGTTNELLLGYNSTSGEDISVFPNGIYSSENDSAIMILSRSVANYNFTVGRNVSNSSSLPYTLVTWDCLENYTITTGGFLEPNQTTSSMMKVQDNKLELSYLVVEANFSDFTPHIGDEVLTSINVTDNLGNDIEDAGVAIVVADQIIAAQDVGNGKYQATLDTSSMLGFYNVTIFTKKPPEGYLQGMSNLLLRVGVADITITNVSASKTVVGQSYSMFISVRVENNGDLTETFYLSTYANETLIRKKAILSLLPGNSTTINFIWNTTGFAKGEYTMSAVAATVPGEANIADNTYTDGIVIVSIPGDVDGDLKVDASDLVDLSKAYGSTFGSPTWNSNCDVNGDNKVDVLDLFIQSKNYGKTNS